MPKAKTQKLSQGSAISQSSNKGKKISAKSLPKQKSPPSKLKKGQKIDPKSQKSKVPIKASSKKIKKVEKKNPKAVTKKSSPAPVFGKGDPKKIKLPKKPNSPFNIFNIQMQNQMKAMPKFKDLTIAERSKVVKESWDKLSEDQKQQYVVMANEEKKKYDKQIKQLKAKGIDVKKLQGEKRASSEKQKPEKKVKEVVTKPKQVMTAFFQYIRQNREHLKKENPDISVVDVGKKSAEQWKKMTDKQKEPFVKLQEKDKIRHSKETNQFKELGYFINSDGIKSTFLNKKGVAQEFELGTVLPKKVKSGYMFYANEQLKLNSLKGTKVTDKIREIAANWNAFSEKQKQKYDEFSKKDNERYQNQLTDLRKKGYFMTDDGKKSSDLPKKIIKARKPPTKK